MNLWLLRERHLKHRDDCLTALDIVDAWEAPQFLICREHFVLGFDSVMKPVLGQQFVRSPIERADGAEAYGPRIETRTRLTVSQPSRHASISTRPR